MAPRSVKPVVGIKGMDIVMSNLNKEIVKIKVGGMKGLIEAAILIRRDMDKTPPLIPIAKKSGGNLRASWFTETIKSIQGFGILMGFSANYAVFVHEMVDQSGRKINWSRPGSGPKFFEKAIKRNKDKILQIIGNNARIKK